MAPCTIENLACQLNAADIVVNIFSDLTSTRMRKKYISEHFIYTEATQMPLQTGSYKDFTCYISISKLLTNFLKCEDLLECISQSVSKSQDVLDDFADGNAFSQYRQLAQDASHGTIFLLLYTDELELVNPLGGAAGRHKILPVNFSILNLHPRHRSCSVPFTCF